MTYRTLTVRTEDGVMTVCLTQPIRLADGADLSAELTHVCTQAASAKEVRVLLIAGNHKKAFSPEIACRPVHDGGAQIHSLSAPVAALDLPVIAAINGDALDEGLELALACDIRIAVQSARFGLTQIRAGHIPGDGGTQRLWRLVGKAKAAEMIFTGETIDAEEALRTHLIHRIAPSDDLMPAALRIARDMAAKSPLALSAAKEAVYKGMDLTLEQGLRLEADLYFLLHTAADRTEGITAFREKRTPDFKGR